MPSNNIFITGPPRSGKSTMVSQIIDELGLNAEGIRTPDIREKGKRKGFKLVDIKTDEEGILSHVDQEEGPKVSRYRVNMKDLERFTELSLKNISKNCDIVVIDEIGTMELYSDRFKQAVLYRLKDNIPVLAVLHRHHVDKYEEYGEVLELTKSNYDILKIELKKKVKSYLD
ncbi:MAG: NTPase [Thermoplasmata archaeon]